MSSVSAYPCADVGIDKIDVFLPAAFSLAKAATKGNALNFSAPASKIVIVSAMLTIFHHTAYSLPWNSLIIDAGRS